MLPNEWFHFSRFNMFICKEALLIVLQLCKILSCILCVQISVLTAIYSLKIEQHLQRGGSWVSHKVFLFFPPPLSKCWSSSIKNLQSHISRLPQAIFVVSYYCAFSSTASREPIPAPVFAQSDLSGLLFVWLEGCAFLTWHKQSDLSEQLGCA